MLSFSHTKVINWLYKNGYEIKEFLKEIENLSESYDNLDDLVSNYIGNFRNYESRGFNTLQRMKENIFELCNKYLEI